MWKRLRPGWKRLRSRFSHEKQSPPWTNLASVTHLSVDGRVHPLHREFADFREASATDDFALLATTFFAFNAGVAEPPYFTLAESLGRGSEVMEQSALHCLHCFARHNLNALAVRSLMQNKPPVRKCQQCGCPEAVMIYDREAGNRNGAAHALQRTDDAGRRIEHVYFLHSADEPGPEAMLSVIDHVSRGADSEGCRISTRKVPRDHEDLHGLALAMVYEEEQEGLLSQDAILRTRTMLVHIPDVGPVFMAVVTAPD